MGLLAAFSGVITIINRPNVDLIKNKTGSSFSHQRTAVRILYHL